MSATSAASSTSSIFSQLGLSQQTPVTATSGNTLDMNSFLTLMTEQMKDQDPTKPLDSSAYLGQLAQFADLQGVQQLNTGIQGIAGLMGQQQAVQVAGLIGHEAYIQTNSAALDTGGTESGKVTATAAGAIDVQVKDSAGNVIRDIPVTATAAGDTNFTWDGLDANGQAVPAGTYTFSAGSGTSSLSIQLASRITSVSFTSQGIVLNLEGHNGVNFDQILSIS
jgi:flagellar basal-body rod modification protein FlgD